MKLHYLGTGAAEGWPALFCNCAQCEAARELGGKNIRTRSQAIIYTDDIDSDNPDDILLIDLPPDTYMHCLHQGLRLDKVGHLLITHSHNDHFCPTELHYRCGIFANPMPPFPLNVYGNEHVEEKLNNALGHHDSNNWPTGVQYNLVETFKPFQAGNFTVTPLLALHDRKERCLIYVIEHGGKRILYGNDTGIFPEETWDYIAGKPFDLVSLDCTSGINKEGSNHMGIPDAIEVEQLMVEANCLKPTAKIVLHHFSHNGGPYHELMLEKAAHYGFDVSYDGGVWEI